MRLIVQLQSPVATPGAATTPALDTVRELQRAVRELGIDLRPVHPDSDDPALARWWGGELPDDLETATRVVTRLRAVSGVESAYVAPAAGLPDGTGH